MVGCVIVKKGAIIGEGGHIAFHTPHAERIAIAQAQKKGESLQDACAYVTLCPCAHYGKTPPCTSALIQEGISRVVIAMDDPNPLSLNGIEILRQAQCRVEVGLLQNHAYHLNRRYITAINQQKPYVILKWAQSADGFIAPKPPARYMLSGRKAQSRVHQWRSEEDAILIGKHTALIDNPQLNVRYGKGKQPIRIVLCGKNALPTKLNVCTQTHSPRLFYTSQKGLGTPYIYMPPQKSPKNILQHMYAQGIHSVLVEGGPATLHRFISHDLWHEARILYTPKQLYQGIAAPVLPLTATYTKSEAWYPDVCYKIIKNTTQTTDG